MSHSFERAAREDSIDHSKDLKNTLPTVASHQRIEIAHQRLEHLQQKLHKSTEIRNGADRNNNDEDIPMFRRIISGAQELGAEVDNERVEQIVRSALLDCSQIQKRHFPTYQLLEAMRTIGRSAKSNPKLAKEFVDLQTSYKQLSDQYNKELWQYLDSELKDIEPNAKPINGAKPSWDITRASFSADGADEKRVILILEGTCYPQGAIDALHQIVREWAPELRKNEENFLPVDKEIIVDVSKLRVKKPLPK